MNKLGRVYRLKIESKDGDFDPITIQNPVTNQFTVQRRMSSAVNQMSCDIYNLDRSTRDILFQQPWGERNKRIVMEGGYDELSTMFTGEIWGCYSYREGADIITHIDSQSTTWDLQETAVYTTLDAGLTVRDVLMYLSGRFNELKIGAIGEYPEKLLREVVLNGNCWELFKQYSDNTAFIDNGKIYALKTDEAIEGDIFTISPESGLLATPRQVEVGQLQIQMVFEPRLKIGQLVQLEAVTQEMYNGVYEVYGVQHTGTISEAVAGDLKTVVYLFVGYRTFKTVQENAE